MDAQRAQEISSSANMKSVQYNGQEVYIEHVDRSSGQATVHPLNDPSHKISVSISELNEA